MRAVQIVAPGKVEVVDVPVPEVAPNEVLVKVAACVTCPHWDITLYRGVDIFERPGWPQYPIPVGYPGHEMSGDVVAAGDRVSGLAVGDRVATLVNAGERVMGFYCEYINRPESDVVAIADDVTYEAGASMEMARYVSAFVRLLGDVAGKRTGVTGVGPAGLIALQMLKALGARQVVAVDLLKERLAMALQLGADETVDAATGLDCLADAPFEAAIDCSGSAAGVQSALDHTRGAVSVFGVPHGIVRYGIQHWGRDLLSSGNPTAADTQRVLDLWRAGQLDTAALVSARLPFEQYERAVKMLIERQAIKVALCPTV